MHLKMMFVPLGIITASILVGLLFNKLLFVKLRSMASKTPWEIDDIMVDALKGLPFLWFFLLGVYIASFKIDVSQAFLQLGYKVLLFLFLLSVIIFLGRFASNMSAHILKQTGTPFYSISLLLSLTKLSVYVIGVLVLLQTMGVSVFPILTALGIGGLAVSLAMQDTFSNLFAGLHIILSKQIQPGDFIRLDSGHEGYVQDITLRNTTVCKLTNNIIVIPNSKIANAIVTNFYKDDTETSFLVDVGVSYDSNLEHVESITLEVARDVMKTVEGGVPEFEPLVRFHTFDKYSIVLTVVLRAQDYVSKFPVRHVFVKRLMKSYREQGIHIPYPISTVLLKNQAT